MDDLLYGSWCSTISGIQGMLRDICQPKYYFCMGPTACVDARKCKYIFTCPSDWKDSIVDAHVGTCNPSM